MKIFLSWHGPRSSAVAAALCEWLKRAIHAVKPFYSPEMEKGARWSSELDNALEGTRFGIVCLTPDNLDSPWIHYEVGALSKTKDAKIWTFLVGLTPADVPQPLGKFQHTVAKESDTRALLRDINAHLADVGEEPLADEILKEQFDQLWPKLEQRLKKAEAEAIPISASSKAGREVEMPHDERAILNEILESVRNQERRLSGLEELSRSSDELTSRQKQSSNELRVALPAEWRDSLIGDFVDEFATLISASEWKIEKSEKADKILVRLRLKRAWTAGQIDERIKEAAATVGQQERMIDWEL